MPQVSQRSPAPSLSVANLRDLEKCPVSFALQAPGDPRDAIVAAPDRVDQQGFEALVRANPVTDSYQRWCALRPELHGSKAALVTSGWRVPRRQPEGDNDCWVHDAIEEVGLWYSGMHSCPRKPHLSWRRRTRGSA